MYGKFSVGFKVINERATTELQYRGTSLAGMYGPVQPMHMSTLPGMTEMVTPLAIIHPDDPVFSNVCNTWHLATC